MLKIIKRVTLAVPSLVLASTTLVAVPVYAHDSVDDGNTTTTQTETRHKSSNQMVSSHETENEAHDANEDSAKRTEFHNRGKDLLEQAREKHHNNLTDDQRKHVCENHKHGLNTKFQRISRNAQRIQDRITSIFDKAQAYQQANNLTVDNWDTLVANANTAKATSAEAIAALKAVTPTIDCSGSNTAQDIATFKAAAQTVRTDLKAYKTSVKTLLKALHDAKKAGEGSDQ